MALSVKLAIPKGSTVLVTGVSGFVGSHIADQFLQYGYNVRGTVRDVAKSEWMHSHFETAYGKGRFDLVAVSDVSAEGALSDAIKGVSAVVHVASNLSFSPDPNQVIPESVAGAVNALKAAYSEPSVKRFVLTSTKDSAAPPAEVEQSPTIDHDSWNDMIVTLAWAPPPYTPERGGIVYAASKVEQERGIWKFHEENKDKRPDLVVNAVLPAFILGPSLSPEKQGYPSSSETIALLWKGDKVPEWLWSPMYHVDVQDTARLHVAAAILEDVKSERVFGMVDPFNWDQVLDILRKQNPDRKFHDNFTGGERIINVLPKARAEQLLKDLGRPGWTSLEECLANACAKIQQAE
ncbi:hypothetical protein HIM_05470 [Hirsutella minnesotensis 3608]|uniref:NAD-dependent epimerase/dehydratase domain-containing protein n=1 Tax=Hirsutella minnesotensis 3608 TaxID=1043627 RepID=A0A0F8A5A4_9HYPO|nr:hypothetical protein HIM_05470 [Hirsutella minnesotensis 3608]